MAQTAWKRMENCVKPGVLRSRTMDFTRGTVPEKHDAKSSPIRCNAGRRYFGGASDTTHSSGTHGADRYRPMSLKPNLLH